MNKTACFGCPFLFITLEGFVGFDKKHGKVIPFPSSMTEMKGVSIQWWCSRTTIFSFFGTYDVVVFFLVIGIIVVF